MRADETIWDAIVVGTGFGGSASAARLAESGMRVLVLERGPWWGLVGEALGEPGMRRAWPRGLVGSRKFVRNVRIARGRRSRELMLAGDGLLELHRFEHLASLTGSGVGGGSLIYTNIQAQPGPEFFRGFPAELAQSELAPWYARVRAMLRPSPIGQRPDKNRAFEQAVAGASGKLPIYPDLAIAWGDDPSKPQRKVNAAGFTQTTCNHCGECVLGCPTTAKTTLDQTYVAAALQAGATLRPLAEVVAIGELARGRGYEVRIVDHAGRRGTQTTARARKLVLACGTLNTLRLLFAARDRHRSLPRISTALGHRFSPNADLGALFVAAKQLLHDSTRGPAFNAFMDVREHEGGPTRYLVGEGGLPASALPLPKIVQRMLGTTGILLAMGADASTGTIGFDGEFLRSEVGRDIDPELFDAIESDAAKLTAAYAPKATWINAPSRRGSQSIATVHPLGGAAIGRHTGEGVVDHRGEVFGHPGLHVADGSLFPRSPGVPPSMTIAALAERQAALMLG
ncbi:GMC oxidoreductase [Nannocystaceae bacterium ST9]